MGLFVLFFCCAELMYVYIDPGAADDANELPFKKGEHLDIIDKSGKWWEARTSAGRKGSMYFLHLILPVSMKTDIFLKKNYSCTFKLFTIANLNKLRFPLCNGRMDGCFFRFL